jgi:hypothetical protein
MYIGRPADQPLTIPPPRGRRRQAMVGLVAHLTDHSDHANHPPAGAQLIALARQAAGAAAGRRTLTATPGPAPRTGARVCPSPSTCRMTPADAVQGPPQRFPPACWSCRQRSGRPGPRGRRQGRWDTLPQPANTQARDPAAGACVCPDARAPGTRLRQRRPAHRLHERHVPHLQHAGVPVCPDAGATTPRRRQGRPAHRPPQRRVPSRQVAARAQSHGKHSHFGVAGLTRLALSTRRRRSSTTRKTTCSGSRSDCA